MLERNGLTVTSPTEKLMYLMISFMGPNSEFLEPHMKEILRDAVQKFFRRSLDVDFQFNATFEGIVFQQVRSGNILICSLFYL